MPFTSSSASYLCPAIYVSLCYRLFNTIIQNSTSKAKNYEWFLSSCFTLFVLVDYYAKGGCAMVLEDHLGLFLSIGLVVCSLVNLHKGLTVFVQ